MQTSNAAQRSNEREAETRGEGSARSVSFCTRSILHGRLARSKQAILPIDFGSWGWPMVDGAGYEFQQDLPMRGLTSYEFSYKI